MLGQTGAWAGFRFPSTVPHASQVFQKQGYESMLLGFAHEIAGGGCPDSYYEEIGFDTLWFIPRFPARDLKEKFPGILDSRKHSDRPFYLQIGTFETHKGYGFDGAEPDSSEGVTVPESPALTDGPGTRDDFAALQGSVKRLDEGLGYVLEELDRRGLTEDTIVVFTSDHGLPMPREKTTLYDRGIGVFLLMRYPGHFQTGTRYDELVSNVDVLPTLFEAAGGRPASEGFEGKSFWSLVENRSFTPRQEVFAEKTFHTSYDPIRCVRTDRYKYIYNFASVRPENYCLDIYNTPVLHESLHLLARSPNRHDELYDLKEDPTESTNLAESPEHVHVREDLARRLVRWMADTNDPLLDGPVASPRFYERLEWLKSRL
jgi:arylsulfatase A-like enzyme